MFNCQIEVDVRPGYLPVINDPKLYETFKEALSEYSFYEFDKPLMIAEDFSFYQRAVPGIFYYIGTRNEQDGFIHSLHSSKFNFNITALETGLRTYITLSKKLGVLDE